MTHSFRDPTGICSSPFTSCLLTEKGVSKFGFDRVLLTSSWFWMLCLNWVLCWHPSRNNEVWVSLEMILVATVCNLPLLDFFAQKCFGLSLSYGPFMFTLPSLWFVVFPLCMS
jgi:hypothetical protein